MDNLHADMSNFFNEHDANGLYKASHKLKGSALNIGAKRLSEVCRIIEEKGKLDTKDVKSFLESLEQKGKESDEKFKAELKTHMKEIIDELGLATKEDLAKLKEDLK